MQARPDPGLLPFFQPPPARTPTTEPHFGCQFLPTDAGPQDEEDAPERLAILDTRTTTLGFGRFGRDERCNRLPERVGDLLPFGALLVHASCGISIHATNGVLKRALTLTKDELPIISVECKDCAALSCCTNEYIGVICSRLTFKNRENIVTSLTQ
jgi:hypothetical protein